MDIDKKEDPFNGKWAVVTVNERLPSRGEQIARARAWGVTESMLGRKDISALIVDDVTGKRTTNWPGLLKKRAVFLDVMGTVLPAGDQVFFATPLCIGFSPAHARQTIERIWSCGMLVYVHTVRGNGSALYEAGDDITDLLDMVAAEQNAANVRKSRNKV
ncbi:hypothetical protein DL1_00055 [Thioclava dalianensis]|uniref:Uncharacterized protein n=2 Tax=Thioclava dalianensis TaxID=1185766 RepID=A0A074TJ88_9RHOB|nr:hypothetical protein DL1_00055 [Thioclava dalianensis]SFN63320.1 hypothetical protein SAMN05216224_10878 [Thioclava dalianensis]